MDHPIGALPRTPFPASRDFPSRGNERYGEKNRRVIYFMYHSCVSPFGGWRHHLARWEACHMTQKVNPVTLTLYSSPERAIPQPSAPQALSLPERKRTQPFYTTRGASRAPFLKICGEAATTTLGAKGPVKLKNPWAEGPSILRTFPSEPYEPSEPSEPSRQRRVHKKLFFFLTKTILKFTDMHDIILSES